MPVRFEGRGTRNHIVYKPFHHNVVVADLYKLRRWYADNIGIGGIQAGIPDGN